MSIDVFDPNANKQKNSKYSNWREAAHDKPVNNNPNWRTDPTHKISNSDNVLKDLSKANREIKEYRNNSQVSTKQGADDSGLITARDEKILNQNKLVDQIRSEEFNAYKNRFKRRLENAGLIVIDMHTSNNKNQSQPQSQTQTIEELQDIINTQAKHNDLPLFPSSKLKILTRSICAVESTVLTTI